VPAGRGTGWEFTHVCIDDSSRLAYAEVLSDERARTVVGVPASGPGVVSPAGIEAQRVLE
jgi:hypothetical protein